jgi:hypothetical protein
MYSNYAVVGKYNNWLPKINYFGKVEKIGVAQFVGYYQLKKGVKQKYMRVVTGLKYDLDFNIADHDADADNIRLFFLEKSDEFYKRWESKKISTVLKYLPENQFISRGNFNNFVDLVTSSSSLFEKKKINYHLQFIYNFYFRGKISFNYKLLDGPYGSFNPIFNKINVQPNWSSYLQKVEIKNWHSNQFFSQKLISALLCSNFNVVTIQPRYRPILFKIPKRVRTLQKYGTIMSTLAHTKNFFDLFKLSIYQSWRHNRFFSRKKSIHSVAKFNLPFHKRKPFLKKKKFLRLYTVLNRQEDKYDRFVSPHELAKVTYSQKKYFFSRSSSFIFEPIFFSKNDLNFRTVIPCLNFKNYYKLFLNNLSKFNLKIFKFKFFLQKNFSNVLTLSLSSRYISSYFTPSLQIASTNQLFKKRYKYRKKTNYLDKKSKFSVIAQIQKKKINFLTNASTKISAYVRKILKFFFKLTLVINVLHQHFARSVESNRILYRGLVSYLISGLNNRLNLLQRFLNQFNYFYDFYKLKRNFHNVLNKLLKHIKPGYGFRSLLTKNFLTYKNFNFRVSLFRIMAAFVAFFPDPILPMIGSFALHSLETRTNYEQQFDESAQYLFFQSSSIVYPNFIKYNGFRYYYAGQLNYSYFTSAFQKKISISFSNFISNVFLGNIRLNSIFKILGKRGLNYIWYRKQLINYFTHKSRFFNLRLRHKSFKLKWLLNRTRVVETTKNVKASSKRKIKSNLSKFKASIKLSLT